MNASVAPACSSPTLVACTASIALHALLLGALFLAVRHPESITVPGVLTPVTLVSLESEAAPVRAPSLHSFESNLVKDESLSRRSPQQNSVREYAAQSRSTPRREVSTSGGGALAPQAVEIPSAVGSTGAVTASGSPLELVRAHLLAQQRYPERARRRGIEGEVQVEIVLKANGEVSSKRIVKPATSPLLNEEVLRMVERADPFPRASAASRSAADRKFLVTIRFMLAR